MTLYMPLARSDLCSHSAPGWQTQTDPQPTTQTQQRNALKPSYKQSTIIQCTGTVNKRSLAPLELQLYFHVPWMTADCGADCLERLQAANGSGGRHHLSCQHHTSCARVCLHCTCPASPPCHAPPPRPRERKLGPPVTNAPVSAHLACHLEPHDLLPHLDHRAAVLSLLVVDNAAGGDQLVALRRKTAATPPGTHTHTGGDA